MWWKGLALSAALVASFLPMIEARSNPEEVRRTVTVEGLGEVAAVPDVAVIVAGVETTRPAAADAIDENNQAVEGLFALAREFGVAERDLQTAGFSVSPRYERNKPAEVTGYRVSNRVNIRFRQIAELGKLLDGLIKSGSNRIDSVSFVVGDAAPLKVEARKRAMADARARAELYAEAAGGQLGGVISVDEPVTGGPVPRAAMMMDARAAAAPSEVPVALGESVTSVRVVVRYELSI